MRVHEMGKGPYQACMHLCATGCGIYADRPRSCRTFECQWLRGTLEVDGSIEGDLRPDSCGVIFDYRPDTAFGEVYTAWEVEPGASARGPARDVIRGLEERFLVVVMTGGREGVGGLPACSFVGPPHLVAQASDVMWSRR